VVRQTSRPWWIRRTALSESRDLELAALCQSCGLCCDGSLFGRVRLESGEVFSARRLHLPVVQNGKSFELPCTALVQSNANRHCAIYVERPESCRRFVCELYAEHAREGGSLADGMAVVRRAKALLAFLETARLHSSERGGASWDDEDSNPRIETWRPVVRELTEILDLHFARANTRNESAEPRETRASAPRAATCRIGRPRVSWRRRSLESRSSRHSRSTAVALGTAGLDDLAGGFGAHVERIERGVGRPLAPRESLGDGGNRRGSAKHRRGTGLDAGRP
jgi:uncharacterized protein